MFRDEAHSSTMSLMPRDRLDSTGQTTTGATIFVFATNSSETSNMNQLIEKLQRTSSYATKDGRIWRKVLRGTTEMFSLKFGTLNIGLCILQKMGKRCF